MDKDKRTAIEVVVRRIIKDDYNESIKSNVKIEVKHLIETFRAQISALQSNNRNLLKHQEAIQEMHTGFVKAMPKAFEYMHAKYGQGQVDLSPKTYAQMAMNIIKFKTLKFDK